MNAFAAPYVEWFRFTIEHAFHGARDFTDWHAVPTAETHELAARAGLLVRQSPGTLRVFAPAAYAIAPDAGRAFEFVIVPSDPHFAGYTLPQAPPGLALVAGSARAVREPSGAWRLHAGERLGPESLAPCPDAAERGLLPAPLRVRIGLDHALDEALPHRCVVRLDAAATYWKYYLQGVLAEREVAVVDVDGQVVFQRTDEAQAGGRRAAVFVSDRAIALRARPPERFQLRERAAFGDKVLMKRLPVASAGARTRTAVGEQAVLVSEIFVNL
jgi:hypothetical protein